jgi:hypothetical protein
MGITYNVHFSPMSPSSLLHRIRVIFKEAANCQDYIVSGNKVTLTIIPNSEYFLRVISTNGKYIYFIFKKNYVRICTIAIFVIVELVTIFTQNL